MESHKHSHHPQYTNQGDDKAYDGHDLFSRPGVRYPIASRMASIMPGHLRFNSWNRPLSRDTISIVRGGTSETLGASRNGATQNK